MGFLSFTLELAKLVAQVSANFFTVALAGFGLLHTVRVYSETKRKDRLQQDVVMRREFVLNETLRTMAMRIEHSDPVLAEMLEILNGAENPTAPGIVPLQFNDDHRDLDSYINHLEAIASLRVRGWLEDDDLAGLWEYYISRLFAWTPLQTYIIREAYAWRDLKTVKEEIERLKRGWEAELQAQSTS